MQDAGVRLSVTGRRRHNLRHTPTAKYTGIWAVPFLLGRMLMRLSIAALALLFSSNLACGASVSLDPPGDGGPSETSSDADPDVLPDGSEDAWPETGPSGCGWGACPVATSCFDGCNECWCTPDGGWSCTTRGCVDAEPPPPPPDSGPPPPPPTCPKDRPPSGSYCPGPLKCSYMNSCGASDYATCDYPGARWNVSVGPCTGPTCPPSLPKEGTSCTGALKCDYWKSCGPAGSTSDLAYCDASTGRWKIYYSECPKPPPPPPSCPTSPPKDGSLCSSPYASCAWNNGCGALTHGFCEGGRWWLSDSGCVPGCPAAKPTSGVACKPPSATSCTYVTSSTGSSYCESNCFCAEDYRWACIPGGCSSGGGGGWEDAGPPMPY